MTRKTVFAAALAATLVPPAGHACFLEIGPTGSLSTSDPLTIPVLVAARGAVAEDRIAWFESSDEEAVRNTIFFLSYLPRIVARATITSADGGTVFSVLQVQTGYWTRYRVAEDGMLTVEGHSTGPVAGEDVIAVSDSALVAILRGRLDVETARDLGLIRGRGASADGAMRTFEEIVGAFETSSFGQLVRSAPVPLFDDL